LLSDEYLLIHINNMADIADPGAIDVAESSGPQNGASGMDGDNKFQKAISAWRSMA